MEPQGTPSVQRAEEEEGELGEAWGQVELIKRTKEGHCHQRAEGKISTHFQVLFYNDFLQFLCISLVLEGSAMCRSEENL